MSSETPAGWYPDPHGEADLRYWDGSEWTQHTSPEPQGAPGAAAREPALAGPTGPSGDGGGRRGLLIGLGALVAVGLLVGLLFVTGVIGGDDGDGGGGDSDEEEIEEVVMDFYSGIGASDGDKACDTLTEDAKDEIERDDDMPCEDSVEEGDFTQEQQEEFNNIEVKNIEVDGDKATAEAEASTTTQDVELENVDDEWKIADVAEAES
jgi:hypothetical protein